MQTETAIEFSIVIPLKNEEESAPVLYNEILAVMEPFSKSWEVIFINDGSTDATESILLKLAQKDHRLKIINFRRNFGQTAAMAAGFKFAKGNVIVAMDGDLQNDPKDIPRLVAKLQEGFDVVSGWRRMRKDKTFSRKLPSKIANVIISKVTDVPLHDYGCSLKAYRRQIISLIELHGEMHRFIPALLAAAGARITELEVNHRPRRYGTTKYSISRTSRVIMDLLTVQFLNKFSARPLHVIGLPGLASFFVGFILALYLTIQRLFFEMELTNRPILILTVLLMFIGAQFITIGLLGEMIARLYFSSDGGKRTYFIRSIVSGGETLEH